MAPKQKLRYDLFSIFEWTAAIAFVCALLAGGGGQATWTYTFPALPNDDATLHHWLAEQGRQDVTVRREANSITLEATAGAFTVMLRNFDVLPRPPWDELGYPSLTGARGSTRWSLFGGRISVWLSGFALLILLAVIRRRYLRPRG